jgi:hypothetical protein
MKINPSGFLAGVSVAAATALAALATVPAVASAWDPSRLYGERIRFEVFRDGAPVGEHVVEFREDADGLAVEARFEIRIRFLVFTAYRYTYRSESLWQDGRLARLVARTDDNGEVTEVSARVGPDGLRIVADDRVRIAPAGVFPTDHWHSGVLGTGEVLNTITGQVNAVTILSAARERVPAGDGFVDATRYDYSGDLETSVWYDDAGRWVGMRFLARDGSEITYRCRECAPADRAS